jgi:hypothetical protein
MSFRALWIKDLGFKPLLGFTERSPLPQVTVVDCDHITYFNSDAGLKALAKALMMEFSTHQ